MTHIYCTDSFPWFQDEDNCALGPCENGGSCIDDVNSYTCNCITGFIGEHCETGETERSASTNLAF